MTGDHASLPTSSLADDLDWAILDRYFGGTGTPEDRRTIEAWAARSTDHRDELTRIRRIWEAGAHAPSQFDTTAAWRAISGRLDGSSATMTRAADTTWRPVWTRALRTAGAVAAAALVVGTGIVVGSRARRMGQTTAEPVARTYATAAGERATVALSDGSRVTLAPSTTMRVSLGGSDDATSIAVTGEAMFTVAHHGNHPFTVRTGRVVTRVLGTRFLIRRYPDDAVTRVVVADGRVAVHAEVGTTPDAPVVLNANMMAVVSDSGGATVTPDIALDDYVDLTADRLVFHGTAVSDIVAALGRAYAVDIRLSDTTLAAHRVTMTVPVSQRSIDDVLTLLTKTLNARYVRNGSVVTITPGGVTHRRLKPFTVETEHGR